MSKAIHEVAADVLRQHNAPMSADEIYDAIVAKELYEFKAKSPRSVLRSQLRRHTANVESPNQAKELRFKLVDNGKFALI